jgi:preprotein translocase subunit SecY
MFETIINAFKVKEIRRKIYITIALLLVYRIGCFIPVPGIDSVKLSEAIGDNSFLSIMSAMTGGSLSNGTLFAMGIGPYINASIIIQLLTIGIPALERLSKQGEEGRKKLAQYTRYLTIILAIAQALGILINFGSNGAIDTSIIGSKAWTYAYMVLVYTAGASLTMWLGERITEYGIGNGISLLIFVGILATAATSLLVQFRTLSSDFSKIWGILGFIIAVIVIFGCIVAVDLAERRINIQYAKQIKGRKMYGGQSTMIPIKVNGSGVLPLIFAFALISFPDLLMSMFWPDSGVYTWYRLNMGSSSWLYIVVLSILILAFSFFYAQVQFNPVDISKSIQQNGGFIKGIRPGKPTADFLKTISGRITLFGAIFLALIALIPTLLFKSIGADFMGVFSTTGLLIVVSVALEFDKQLQSQIMMKNYKGFLK